MNKGWIKLHRKSRENFLYKTSKPLTRREAWEDMLMDVNTQDSFCLIGNEKIKCKRGQAIYSLGTWGKRFNWSKSKVKRFFDLLENEKMIVTKNLRKTTQVTISKYELYQGSRNTDETLTERKWNADETQMEPSKEDKEFKNKRINNNNTDNSEQPSWRTSYEIYLKECSDAFRSFQNNGKLIAEQEYYFPTVNIQKTMEHAFNNYWKLETTWAKKKEEKIQKMNWQHTIKNAVSQGFNKIYYTKSEQAEVDRKREESNNKLMFTQNGL